MLPNLQNHSESQSSILELHPRCLSFPSVVFAAPETFQGVDPALYTHEIPLSPTQDSHLGIFQTLSHCGTTLAPCLHEFLSDRTGEAPSLAIRGILKTSTILLTLQTCAHKPPAHQEMLEEDLI